MVQKDIPPLTVAFLFFTDGIDNGFFGFWVHLTDVYMLQIYFLDNTDISTYNRWNDTETVTYFCNKLHSGNSNLFKQLKKSWNQPIWIKVESNTAMMHASIYVYS